MTYTEAVQVNAHLRNQAVFCDPKQLGDGINLRWVRDPDGLIGFIRGSRKDDFLVMYPVATLKHKVKLFSRMYKVERWKEFTLIK